MKYKQKGYRDSEQKEKRKREPEKPRTPEQRQLRHMMERSANLVLRCHQCSAVAGSGEGIPADASCGGCGAALHCCRNCASFDTGARWECRAPITQPVLDKTAANDCALFKANTVLDATGRRSGGSAPTDARAAFDNLFKKK